MCYAYCNAALKPVWFPEMPRIKVMNQASNKWCFVMIFTLCTCPFVCRDSHDIVHTIYFVAHVNKTPIWYTHNHIANIYFSIEQNIHLTYLLRLLSLSYFACIKKIKNKSKRTLYTCYDYMVLKFVFYYICNGLKI